MERSGIAQNAKGRTRNIPNTRRRGSTASAGTTTRALIIRDPLPLPDPRRPSMIQSLPPWVESSLDALELSGVSGKMTYSIPESKSPTEAERASLIENARILMTFVVRTPANDEELLKATSILLLRMVKALSGPRLDDLSAEALTEAYLDALDDVPSWSVDAALKRWNRGECGLGKDYRWRPSPAELRRVSLDEMWVLKGRAMRLCDLARCEARREFSTEYRMEMLERIHRVIRAIVGREDPIDRMRREVREASQRQLAADRARVLKELKSEEENS